MRIKKFAAVALLAIPGLALAGCASKPSEADLHSNIVEDVEALGVSAEQAKQFADCAVPELHSKLGASSLNTIIEDGAVGARIDADDAKVGDEILDKCMDEILGA